MQLQSQFEECENKYKNELEQKDEIIESLKRQIK